jgi:hypothetical protein
MTDSVKRLAFCETRLRFPVSGVAMRVPSSFKGVAAMLSQSPDAGQTERAAAAAVDARRRAGVETFPPYRPKQPPLKSRRRNTTQEVSKT